MHIATVFRDKNKEPFMQKRCILKENFYNESALYKYRDLDILNYLPCMLTKLKIICIIVYISGDLEYII